MSPCELDGIAIIGMSGRFPGAKSVEQFWQNLVAGIDCISRFRDDELEFSVLSAQDKARGRKSVAARGVLADVDLFDAEFFGIYPREAEIMDPQHRIFLECAWESLESAGYNPHAFDGMIGVFAGASLNTYLLHNLCGDGKFAGRLAGNYQVGEYQAMLGNDKDFFTTRVSYKLNLKGPSMAIQTACSSSLVAVSQACTSLFNYQCDMALAGGVSITFPQKRDYLFEEEGLASVDGTCRTFDAEAKGTVFGHGCAVVLLKRLQDAVQDGDHVLAVIKGSAINNDGCEKIGYAAPSVNAQADVIAMALAAAGVEPESISYIEAHGTGTPLGDPIEIAALTRAFRQGGATTDRFCAIGSGKPNISHLDVASGATGLIKTVLQLRHGLIPPLLHFKSPNPNIDFVHSPFYPVTELQEWKPGDMVRRAGVSAFGVGGTNAHVVLEEPPPCTTSTPTIGPYVFPLSARSEAALAAMRANLAERLQSDDSLALADVAYTLQTGRKGFDHRWTTVAKDRAELVAALRNEIKSGSSGKASDVQRRIAFLFPGQGAQYVGMGRELYDREPVFREEVDRCAAILETLLGHDVRATLYPADERQRAQAESQIHETWMTQPAIFVAEYALARLWQSWGITPSALVGHSIGEYVCAVLAESLTLEDALALLATRARLMQELPPGSMLGVRLPVQDVAAMLPVGASIAAVNSPKLCTVSGPAEVLESFQKLLEGQGIPSRLLATSHAFHSSMMDPMLETFTQASEKVVRRPPVVRWISTCTGREIGAGDMADAGYWSRQLRQEVRFADALDTLFQSSADWVFVEVGPGRTLSQFVRQHPANPPAERIIASLASGDQGESDYASALGALGKAWVAGAKPAWRALHGDQRRLRVPLPTYPFERKRYWVEPTRQAVRNEPAQLETSAGLCLAAREGEPAAESPAVAAPPVERDLSAGNGSSQSSAVSPKQKIAQELRTILLNLSGVVIDNDETSFIDLGFDSLFLSQASQAIDSRFGLKITFRQLLGDLSNVATIAEYLATKLPPERFVEPPSPAQTARGATGTTPVAPLHPAAVAIGTANPPDLGQLQRMLDGHVQNLRQMLDQSRARSPAGLAAIAGNGLRPVHKPASRSTGAEAAGAAPEENKRFGPYKPIERGEQGGLTTRQEKALNRLIERYVKRTAGSKAYTAEHRPHFADPRAVAGFRSQWKEMVYPIVSARSKGAKIWDVDGNEYVDITMGFGTYFFGHSPDWLIAAIEKQLRAGIEIGPQSPLAGPVARMIAEFTGLKRVTFCNTGSEAVMAAMRLARTVTGRNRIVYFAGDYHGMFEEVLVRGAWPNGEYRAQPIAPGIPPGLVENILVLEYGAPESLAIIREHGDEIAAVMVEPVQSRNPRLQPREFLQQVRKLTEDVGAALIFDEVVTGFRCHPGGAQAYFGVEADMATYGKVVGGGIPIGILAGKSRFMDALDGGMWQYADDSFPEVGVTFFAGTFVRHPLAMAAAHAVLKYLQEAGPDLQSRMTERVEGVCRAVNRHMEQAQVPIRMSSFSAFAAIEYAHDLKFASLLWYYLREKGIHIWEGRPCYFTLAHTDADLQKFIDAFRDSVIEMQHDGFLPQSDDRGAAKPGNATPGDADQFNRFPLAEGQREMWLGAQMSPEAAGPHHACNAFLLEGKLDVEALKTALATVVKRHEGLRCTFSADGSEVRVRPDLVVEMPVIDLADLPAAEQRARV
ncbi:MAG: aminotransferase class III-fold pyridoxal phosphate-dependent enzyme, partial [Pirellulaceae bacterium]